MSALHQGGNCANCRYFERFAEGHGECRRYAPRPNAPAYVSKTDSLGALKNDIHWPKVYDRNWCGEFVAQPAS